jgi:hypothetical protein
MNTTVKTVNSVVTGTPVKVNPVQLVKSAARYGISVDELLASYVSTPDKQHLASLNLTRVEVETQFPNIHQNILDKLRVFKKIRKPRTPKVVVEPTPVVVEEVADTTEEVFVVTEEEPVTA